MIGTRSIRNRLALTATALVLAVVAVIASAAFLEARRTAILTASQRLQDVSHQLTDLLVASAKAMRDQAAVLARSEALRSFMRNPTSDASGAALRALAAFPGPPTSLAAVELWDSEGRRLFTTNDSITTLPVPETKALIALVAARDSVAIGWLGGPKEHLGYAVIAAIKGDTNRAAYVVERRLAATSTQAANQIRDLIGSGASLIIGNERGDLWTDFVDSVPPPSMDVRGLQKVVEYQRPPGHEVLSAVSPIPNTPWQIAVEFPRALTLAPVFAMLRRLAVFTLVMLLVAAATAWRASATLTRPIARLVAAANAMSAGDYSHRVDLSRNDEIGALGRAFNTMADNVTEGRRSLEGKLNELEDAEARYRVLFEASPQPMWVYDVKTRRFLAVNNAAVDRYGYTRDEFLSMTILDVWPVEDVPVLVDDLTHLGVEGAAESSVWRHRAHDGSLIEVEVTSRALLFGGHRARLVIINDLTNRRRAEESLRAAQHRLERVIGSSGAVLYELRLEPAGTVLEWISDNVTAMLGYDVDEVKDPRWWPDGVHPADRARLGSRSNQDAYRDGATEYRFRHKDGRYRLLRDDQRLIAEEGKAKKVIGAWMDLTEQRQLETQFRQAQKMEAIGRLAGGVAHDFNNLLTVILAECQFLLTEPALGEATRRECVDQIGKAAERAALLTRQLLTFSRQQLIEPTTLDLNAVVTDVDKMLRRLIGEDVDLRISLGREPAITVADRGQMEQVIVNLVVNARDAMPVGGALTIETARAHLDQAYVDTHPHVVPGEYVLLAVSDTGIGMDEEVKGHIFEPFFTTKDDGKGTGLGLATCYAIARQYGGHIAAYSELGLGTTMKVYLPCTSVSTPERSQVAVESENGTETILLVEDDEHVRRLTARMLQARGYTVLQASDATTALDALGRHPTRVDLLLTDVVLPGMGGRSLADRVLELHPDMSVLFASGYSDDVILQHRLTAHGVVLLHKPFTADALARKVREALLRPGLV